MLAQVGRHIADAQAACRSGGRMRIARQSIGVPLPHTMLGVPLGPIGRASALDMTA